MRILFCLLLLCSSAWAKTFYVDSNSNEEGVGSQARPYRLIQKALNRAQPGVTIRVAKGTYKEFLSLYQSGSIDAPIVIEPWKRGQKPTLDAQYFEGVGNRALLDLQNVSHVHIKGLIFTNFKASSPRDPIYGVRIQGEGQNIHLEDCEFTHFKSLQGISADSQVIQIRGLGERRPLRDLQFRSLKVEQCFGLGSLISVRGNVENVLIENSSFSNCDALGIEFVANAGVSRSYIVDTPRSSVIRRNFFNQLLRQSFSSAGSFSSAKAIYVDGAENMVIENNRIQNCDLSIELNCSKKGLGLKRALVRNNWVQKNASAGVVLGGSVYKAGKVEDVHILNNTFIENDRSLSGGGEVSFRFHVRDCSLKNNLLIPSGDREQVVYLSQVTRQQTPSDLVISNNFYVKRGRSPIWNLGLKSNLGFSSWLDQGYDRQSQWGELLFDEQGLPHSLEQIKDKGDRAVAQSAEDVDGNPRVSGLGIDIGAIEWK